MAESTGKTVLDNMETYVSEPLHYCPGKTHDWVCPQRNICQRHYSKSKVIMTITPNMKDKCPMFFSIETGPKDAA